MLSPILHNCNFKINQSTNKIRQSVLLQWCLDNTTDKITWIHLTHLLFFTFSWYFIVMAKFWNKIEDLFTFICYTPLLTYYNNNNMTLHFDRSYWNVRLNCIKISDNIENNSSFTQTQITLYKRGNISFIMDVSCS